MKKFSLIIILIFITLSCREEIIEPGNFVENINEPVQINERNSYTLLLNARELSMSLSVPAYFNSIRTRFNVTLIDYESGYVSVTVQDYDERERFRYFLAEDITYHSDVLDGYVLKTINIRTENFSGKLKIEFYKTF
ncbi:MAG: hypothetical protein P8X47_03350 [Ignavibacteriaceae bacterium]